MPLYCSCRYFSHEIAKFRSMAPNSYFTMRSMESCCKVVGSYWFTSPTANSREQMLIFHKGHREEEFRGEFFVIMLRVEFNCHRKRRFCLYGKHIHASTLKQRAMQSNFGGEKGLGVSCIAEQGHDVRG